MSKLHIKKGDQVVVLSGVDKGKTGRVLEVLVDKQRAIEKKEAPIHIAKLNLVDPKTGKATRIGRRLNDEGKLVRYSKKSGEEIK